MKGWIHLCHVFSQNILYIGNYSLFFFQNSIICFSVNLEQMSLFDGGSSDILYFANVKTFNYNLIFVTFALFGIFSLCATW